MKDGLRIAMEMSSDCNLYIQENQPWVLAKSDKNRCDQSMSTALNALMMICVIMEPFMPSFSAKVYEQMAIKREIKHETAIKSLQDSQDYFFKLIEGGHVIGTPEPIFREIKEAEIEEWKAKFAGK